MKILLIGSTGVIGSYLLEKLSDEHDILTGNRTSGDHLIDMTDAAEVKLLLTGLDLDAIVIAAGHAHFGPLEEMSPKHLTESLNDKLLGQLNFVLTAQETLKPGGSITLISGILGDDPINQSTALAMVNGAINSFVKAAALELSDKGIRINVVSPGLVEPSADDLGHLFPGHIPVSMERVLEGYLKSIEGDVNGEVIKVY
jgi:NAD(P)-dependent dehydrogenase (short-subunit alcohol dehydrogenase family)